MRFPHAFSYNDVTHSYLVTQLEYAARDAFVAVYAFWRIITLKLRSQAFFTEASAENWSKALSYCQGLLDVEHKPVKNKGGSGRRFEVS